MNPRGNEERYVRGRRRVTLDDGVYVFELRAAGLKVRRYRGRKSTLFGFQDLVNLTKKQQTFSFR